MNTYKTIIFDLDGTLFKADSYFIEAIQKVCKIMGLPSLEPQKIISAIGMPSSEAYPMLLSSYLSDEDIQVFREHIRHLGSDIIKKSAELYHGIPHLLNRLKSEGYVLALYTNGSQTYMQEILNRFNLNHYFTYQKYRVDGLEKAHIIKQILDESKSCRAIVIGDHDVDFQAANETRCLSIGVTYGYGGHAYQKADFTARNPHDIYNTIQKINQFLPKIALQILHAPSTGPLHIGIKYNQTYEINQFEQELKRYINKMGLIKKSNLLLTSPNLSEDSMVVDISNYNCPVIEKNAFNHTEIQERIFFEELKEPHVVLIQDMLKDPQTRQMLGAIRMPEYEDYNGTNNLAYVIKSLENEFIGIVELFDISWKNRRGELSIMIHPTMQRKGYGYEAIQKLLEIAFIEYGMNRVWLRVLENNTSAIKLYEKLHFVREGICRDESLRDGTYVNQIQMSILAKDWFDNFNSANFPQNTIL